MTRERSEPGGAPPRGRREPPQWRTDSARGVGPSPLCRHIEERDDLRRAHLVPASGWHPGPSSRGPERDAHEANGEWHPTSDRWARHPARAGDRTPSGARIRFRGTASNLRALHRRSPVRRPGRRPGGRSSRGGRPASSRPRRGSMASSPAREARRRDTARVEPARPMSPRAAHRGRRPGDALPRVGRVRLGRCGGGTPAHASRGRRERAGHC